MAMKLQCRMERKPEYTRIILPVSEAPRVYMLLDALLLGQLSAIELYGADGLIRCRIAEQDDCSTDAWRITRRSAAYVKSVLLQAAEQPSSAKWLHADIAAAAGEVTICFEP